ncbi:MAG: V-type ATP synthase subunit D [Actinobacteria bacterium]|nr:V-type ATP synthase subunit D [Actinomycetota bacterium]
MPERMNVNPNRMELHKLRKRLQIAKRGHKLLKDKLDEMMKIFLSLVREAADLRVKVEKGLSVSHSQFGLARSETSTAELEEALSFSEAKSAVKVTEVNKMSVIVPQLEHESGGNFNCYSLSTTPSMLDPAIEAFRDLLSVMVKLGEKENAVMMLAEEIERTRRRVNALEYVLIPQIEQTIRFITMKLDEVERSNLTRLMKIKDIVARKT